MSVRACVLQYNTFSLSLRLLRLLGAARRQHAQPEECDNESLGNRFSSFTRVISHW